MAAYKRPPTVPVRKKTDRIWATSPTEFTFSLFAVTDQIHKVHKNLKNSHETLASIPAPIQNNFAQIPQTHHWIQFTETNRSKMRTNSMHLQAVLRDSWWIFITEPLRLEFKQEHTTGGSALQAWLHNSNQRRRRRKGEEDHRIRTGRRKKEAKLVYLRSSKPRINETEPNPEDLRRNGPNLQSKLR